MRYLLIILVSFVTIQLYGQDNEFEYVGTSTEGVDLYIKPSHIKVENEYLGVYKVWISGFIDDGNLRSTQVKIAANQGDDKLKRTYTMKMLYYIDCQKEMLGLCRIIYYDINDMLLLDLDGCDYGIQYKDVIPDTVGESIFNYTCKVAQSKR